MLARIQAPTLDTTMADLLAGWPSARAVIGRRGMACVGCTMARFETIAEAAAAYGFDGRALIDDVTQAKAHVHPDRLAAGRTAARRRPGRSRIAHRDRGRGR